MGDIGGLESTKELLQFRYARAVLEAFCAELEYKDTLGSSTEKKENYIFSNSWNIIALNAMDDLFFGQHRSRDVTGKTLIEAKERVFSSLDDSFKSTVRNILKKISSDSRVLIYNLTEEVREAFLVEDNLKKRYNINMLESFDRDISRNIAENLAIQGHKINYHMKSIRKSIEGIDFCMIGSNTIFCNGDVMAQSQSLDIAESCYNRGIPVYACASSYRYDPEKYLDKNRDLVHPSRIWCPENNNIFVNKEKNDRIPRRLITGIICDFGIVKPKTFIEEVGFFHKWANVTRFV